MIHSASIDDDVDRWVERELEQHFFNATVAKAHIDSPEPALDLPFKFSHLQDAHTQNF